MLRLGNGLRGACDLGENCPRALREVLRTFLCAQDRSKQAQRREGVVEPSVDQQVWNSGLTLYTVGERNVDRGDRAEVQDDPRLCAHDGFKIGGVAASGKATDFGQTANHWRQIRKLILARLQVPA